MTWHNLTFSMMLFARCPLWAVLMRLVYLITIINNNKVPLWAVLMSLVYLCKRKLTSVVKPTRQWGPGDPQVRRAIYEEQHNIAPGRKHNYSSPNYNTGYDNQAISAYNM